MCSPLTSLAWHFGGSSHLHSSKKHTLLSHGRRKKRAVWSDAPDTWRFNLDACNDTLKRMFRIASLFQIVKTHRVEKIENLDAGHARSFI
jgi:hypothetical protein